ncbi:ArsR/SmtB family transcription factor [Streptomyces sp. SID1121]|uniref:ArsR/SmtB family transcription factor n=1 Tax=Streptomyces sp. SID1121 TaxID=3425888 RepID=UPI004055F6EE
MGLRIHLTKDDLLRVTVAQAPVVLWEVVLSLRALQAPGRDRALAGWRRWAAGCVPESARFLGDLVPASGYCPDFLTPHQARDDLEAGIETLLRTPGRRLESELGLLALSSAAAARPAPGRPAPARATPSWMRPLAAGSPRALTAVGDALRAYHDAVVAPVDERLRADFDRTSASRAGILLGGGLEGLLGGLHPRIHWRDPVLELDRPGQDDDVHLDGRGIRFVPSFFCDGVPTVFHDTSLPYTVIFPVDRHDARLSPDGDAGHRAASLEALLGSTRAKVLRSTVTGGSLSTTALSRRLGISPATVSHHTAALRSAGLIRTRRTGTSVSHTPTALGISLAGQGITGSAAEAAGPFSGSGRLFALGGE